MWLLHTLTSRWRCSNNISCSPTCISSLPLFLTYLLDSTRSLHIFLCLQSNECWQTLKNNSSPDTYKSFGNCSALYWGVNVKFAQFFCRWSWSCGQPLGHAYIVLKGEGLGLWRGLCHPDLLPSVQFCSDIRSSSTWNSMSVKLCQIPRLPRLTIDSALTGQFCDSIHDSVIAEILRPYIFEGQRPIELGHSLWLKPQWTVTHFVVFTQFKTHLGVLTINNELWERHDWRS